MAIDKAKLRARLNVEEARRKQVYRDSLGYLSIAVGRLVDPRFPGSGLRDSEMDFMLDNDIDACDADLSSKSWFIACADSEARQDALVDMYFQLRHHLFGFVKSLGLVEQRKYLEAGACFRKSLWYRQTPNRAEPLIRQLETGAYVAPR